MLALGIDPGTETTGYALVDEDACGNLHLLDYGVIKTHKDANPEKRLQTIFSELTNIISLHHPTTGAVEKLFFQKNVTNAIVVGQARGVILLAMAQAGIEILEYSPQAVKISVTGYGAADKKQVQVMVKTILNMKEIPKPDDAADAIAIAICHLHAIGYRSRLHEN